MKNPAGKPVNKKIGRPPYIPNEKDRERVRRLMICGTPVDMIAEIVGVSKPTLYLHYKKEIQLAAQEANAEVAQNLYRQTKKNPAAAIFWMKSKCGWREKDDTNQASAPINIIMERGPDRVSVQKIEEKKKDATTG
jgi:hypothetical protein